MLRKILALYEHGEIEAVCDDCGRILCISALNEPAPGIRCVKGCVDMKYVPPEKARTQEVWDMFNEIQEK